MRAIRYAGAITVLVVATGVVASSQARAAGAPTFVQQVSTHQANKTSVAVTPTTALGAGNRLIVEVGVWSSSSATASTVTDSVGDLFTEVLHFAASEHTEMSIWTAPITAGSGLKPAITAKPTSTADVGVVALEYSGLSAAAGPGSVDRLAQATGLTGGAATVSSGATSATTSDNELQLGFYLDSGFGDTLAAGTGYTTRASVTPTSDIEMLAEDRIAQTGSTQAATAATGANTYWLMASVTFSSGAPGVPVAPTNVVATAGDGLANLAWTAPASGSTITSYTITPFIGTTAQPTLVVSGTPAPTNATVTGLTNSTTYTFTVSATNATGTGAVSAASNPVTPSSVPLGTWSGLQTWPIMPLATHLLYTGKVVSWDGWQQPQPSVVWDPASPNTFPSINAPDSVFCDGAADLPDGRLLVVGGYGGLSTGQTGIVDTSIFDPATQSWSRVADMHNPRWYPTVTELSDGRYVAISGNSTDANTWADTPEVYDPATNSWTLLSKVNTAQVHEEEYPFSYEVPSGDVFVIGPAEDNSHLLNVNNQTWTSTGSSGLLNGSSVMYRPGKILYSGGAASVINPSTARNNTAVIDLTAATPTWRQTSSMGNARVYHTLTMLADGRVLAIGGANTSDQLVITTGVLPTEIWDPATETWSAAAPIAASRNYHSTAILLPDGRVMVSGGGHSNGLQNAGQYSSQIYSPSYLSQGPRPTISFAPAAATYGSTIPVSSPDAAGITAVNLVSLGADTHQIDMNQHFVPLNFTVTGGTVNVAAPSSATTAPPGYYMLFILKNGVPSVASMINIGAAQNQTVPDAPANVRASAGNASANVTWTAPASGGSPITSYTVTPYVNGSPQFPTTVSGTPAPTQATVSGLTNGTAYTFTVAAKNSVGTGNASAASNTVTPTPNPPPAFVQQISSQSPNVSALGVTPPTNVSAGNRLVVQVGVWSGSGATASSVADSAGNTYTKVTTVKAPDNSETSIWTAPVTVGAGTKPVITATATGSADVAVAAMEYSGLSSASGLGAIDTQSTSAGTTTTAGTVHAGATAATASDNELAVGFYADSGYNDAATAGAGWTGRSNVSPNGNFELRTEDQPVNSGALPDATFGTGARTPWAAATVVFASGAPQAVTAPSAPTSVTAVAGNGSATVSWSTPASGGSPISGYTVTSYTSGSAQTPLMISGSPPATTGKVTGLMNGMSYTFTVTATNAIGTGPESSASNSVTPSAAPAPTFVQKVAMQTASKASLAVVPPAAATAGDTLIVETGAWSNSHARVSSVTDSAGNTYTKVISFVASDFTEMDVWSAPVTTGGGTKPTVTVKTSASSADIGAALLEYSGLSSTVDVLKTATGSTTTARTVSSGSTAMTTAPMGLAMGFYVDSGFGTALTADPGYSARANVSPNGNIDLLAEDTMVMMGATPAASAGTGANTVWLMATVVFKSS